MVNTKPSKRKGNHFTVSPDSNYPPNKKQKHEAGLPSGTKKIETDSPATPAPDTPLQQFDLHQHPTDPMDSVRRTLLLVDKNEAEDKTGELTTSPEAKLLKQLKKLSEMKPSIEGCLKNEMKNEMTGSVNLLELFSSSDSKSKDAWKKAGRGLMLLKEGLTILNEAENLLSIDIMNKCWN